MAVELKVPEVGESITEVHIAQWRKQVGQRVEKDENLVEIESDKATVDMPAPITGTLTEIRKQAGEKAVVGEIIGTITTARKRVHRPFPKPQNLRPQFPRPRHFRQRQ